MGNHIKMPPMVDHTHIGEHVTVFSPNTKAELEYVLPEAYYNKMRDKQAAAKGGSKTPTYEGFVANFLAELFHSNLRTPSPFKRTRPYVLEVNHKHGYNRTRYLFPIVIARNEMIKHKDVCAPYILFSEYGDDNTTMWGSEELYTTHGVQGLRFNEHSSINPVVLLEDCAPKRYGRYANRCITTTSITSDWGVLLSWLDELTPKAEEYWKSVGVTPSMSDNIEMYDGVNVNLVGIRLLQSDGAEGVGVFTHVTGSPELYWDFSRRSVGNHIGNNILYAASLWCCVSGNGIGVERLNLGVGYYDWKKNWSKGNTIPVSGISFLSPKLQKFMLEVYADVPESVGHNPDRDRS